MSLSPLDNLIVGDAGIAAYPPGASYGPQLLYDFEFVWITEGTAEGRFDKQTLALTPDIILLARPGMTCRYDWDRNHRTIHAFLHFSFDYSAPEWPPLAEWPLSRRLAPDDILRPLFRYVVGLAQSNVPDRATLLENAITFMLRAFLSGRNAVAPEPLDKLPDAVEKALTAIRRSLWPTWPAPRTSPPNTSAGSFGGTCNLAPWSVPASRASNGRQRCWSGPT